MFKSYKIEPNNRHSFNKERKDNSEAMKNLFVERLYTDIEFIVETKEIKTHKAILAAKNSYFRNMFASNG